jgi:predicted MFS family arabinose efflux permease
LKFNLVLCLPKLCKGSAAAFFHSYLFMNQIFSKLQQSFTGIPVAIWLLAAVSLINRMGGMVITFLSLYLTQALHYDIRSAGYAALCFGLGGIVGHYIGGLLTDRIGFYRVMWLSLFMGGTLLLVMPYFREFWEVCGIIFLMAATSEAFRPANTVGIKEFSDAATRTRAYSLMRVSVNMAIGVALVVGGLLVSLGWEWLFWVDGLTCFGAAIILLLFLKNPKNTPPQYATVETSQIPTETSTTAEISPYRDRDYLVFFFMTLVGAVVFMQLAWTIPVFFKEIYGWSEAKIGLFAAINTTIVMTIEMPLIYRIEKKRPPMWFAQLGIVLYGLSYLFLLLPTTWAVVLAILYMIFISFGEIFVMPFSTSWASQRAGATRQGQYMALYGIAYALTNVLSPFLGTQIIAAFGYSTLWLMMAALSVVAWLGFGYLGRKAMMIPPQ